MNVIAISAGRYRYQAVPKALPEQLPAITREDARRIATKITRKFWPHTRRDYIYPGSSVRRVWLSAKPTKSKNHHKGLGRLIHDMSHRVFRAVYPHKLPHDPLHVRYETDIAAFVADSAWLAKLLQPRPPKAKPTLAEKHARQLIQTETAIARWESKQRRAKNAIRKLESKRRRLARALGEK